MKSIIALLTLLSVTSISHTVLSDESSIAAATDDADSTVAAMIDNQEDDLRDYIRLFMGHTACVYDFPKEDIFNSIADTSLKNISVKAKSYLSSRDHTYFSTMNDEQKDYVASILTQAVIGKWATEISDGLEKEIAADPNYCAKSKDADHEIYDRLAKKILGN